MVHMGSLFFFWSKLSMVKCASGNIIFWLLGMWFKEVGDVKSFMQLSHRWPIEFIENEIRMWWSLMAHNIDLGFKIIFIWCPWMFMISRLVGFYNLMLSCFYWWIFAIGNKLFSFLFGDTSTIWIIMSTFNIKNKKTTPKAQHCWNDKSP